MGRKLALAIFGPYQILRQRDIDELNGFQIPRLIRWDDALLAIQMTVVRTPFLLDFASAYTQSEYDRFAFTEEILDERLTHWSDIFGDDWPTVQSTCQTTAASPSAPALR